MKVNLSPLSSLLNIMFRRNLKLSVGFSMIIAIVVLGFSSSIIAPYNPIFIGRFPRLLPPSTANPLGTDFEGRDIFALTIHGLRNSLIIGLITGVLTTLAGVFLGLVSAYKGGYTDHVIRSIADTFLVIPSFPLLVLIGALVRVYTIVFLAIILALFTWASPTRTIRSQILSFREMQYANLSRLSGLGELEIAFKEVLPNVLPYIGVIFGSSVTSAIGAEVGLRLIGIGPTAITTLGYLLNYSLIKRPAFLLGYYHWIMAPAILLILIFVSIQMINIGLDEIYNPRLRRITYE